MKIFHDGNNIRCVCWDRDYTSENLGQLSAYQIIEVDEYIYNPLTLDIAKWWDRGKYYIEGGALYSDDNWTEPIFLPPVIHPLTNEDT